MPAHRTIKQKRFTPVLLAERMAGNDQLLILAGADGLMQPTPDLLLEVDNEYKMQLKVFEAFERMALVEPLYKMIFPVPNGQYRTGQRMEAGVKSGVPDFVVAVPRFPYHGAYIELKVKRNTPSPDQERWMEALTAQGYYCQVISDSVEKVVNTVVWYLSLGEW